MSSFRFRFVNPDRGDDLVFRSADGKVGCTHSECLYRSRWSHDRVLNPTAAVGAIVNINRYGEGVAPVCTKHRGTWRSLNTRNPYNTHGESEWDGDIATLTNAAIPAIVEKTRADLAAAERKAEAERAAYIKANKAAMLAAHIAPTDCSPHHVTVSDPDDYGRAYVTVFVSGRAMMTPGNAEAMARDLLSAAVKARKESK
jgi:hypothetical protein